MVKFSNLALICSVIWRKGSVFFQIDKKITYKCVDFSNTLEKYANFNHLLGVEVDENYNGVVIKNGQKYIQPKSVIRFCKCYQVIFE